MTQKISSATDTQWAMIDEIKERTIAEQTKTITLNQATQAIHAIYQEFEQALPEVELYPSPQAAISRAKVIAKEKGVSVPVPYHSLWTRCWSAWYEGAEVLGVKLDQHKLDLLKNWSKAVPICLLFEDVVIVVQNPVEIQWDESRLHCVTGPSVQWSDGYAMYSIEGVRVTEQIVMRPETLTVEQMLGEENKEVQRIMINRFGWLKFLRAIDAIPIDERDNYVDGTKEALFAPTGLDFRVLVCSCPSKAEPYFLEVEEDCENCEQAQDYISGDLKPHLNCLGSS